MPIWRFHKPTIIKLLMMNNMIQLPITLEQLITTLQQLPPGDRAQVAKALIDIELKSDLANLLEELYSQPPIDEITDVEVLNEIKIVRQQLKN